MAHKVCIDGTVYEIDGGKAMVGGTVYEIDHGTTLVDGTAYEVGFDDGMREVTITTSTSNVQIASIEIDGVEYGDALRSQVIRLPVGTVVKCKVAKYDEASSASIILNGETVVSGNGSYHYVITREVQISTMSMLLPYEPGKPLTYNVTLTIAEK